MSGSAPSPTLRWRSSRPTTGLLFELAAIVESSDDAILTKTLEGVISSWNAGAERMYGYTAEEAVGRPILIIVPEAHEGEVSDILARIARGERLEHFETVRRRKDGRLIDVSLTVSPVNDDRGGVTGASVIARDISERKAAEAERERLMSELDAARAELQAQNDRLRSAEQLKSELVATVSHELRTPLTSIVGFTELLRHRDFDASTRERFLRTIHREGRRLTSLIDDFLDLRRIEAGSLTLAVEPVEIGSLLEQQVELFSGHSDAHTITLQDGTDGLVVLADRGRIAQVVGNLLSNAIKYSPGGGPVTVRASARDGALRVSVRDSGMGIPTHQHGEVFTKFFRAEAPQQQAIGGTGLGLALCRELVELHGGRIGFDSVPDVGSTFWFELPLGERDGSAARRPMVVSTAAEPSGH